MSIKTLSSLNRMKLLYYKSCTLAEPIPYTREQLIALQMIKLTPEATLSEVRTAIYVHARSRIGQQLLFNTFRMRY